MLIRTLKHKLLIGLSKRLAGLSPPVRHQAFAGAGSCRQLCEHIARTGVATVLVVTDKPLRDLGVADRAVQGLVDAGVDLVWYDGVLPDPTWDQVQEGVAVHRSQGGEVVLAVGGGSSIDAAKLIAGAASCPDENPLDWVGHFKIKGEVMPIYVVPTTAGTGSEATMGGVISDSQTHVKSVIASDKLAPAAVALDSELMLGLPPHITAATGMDALTHAIEAYIGTWERGTRSQDARMAVKLIFDNLARACAQGDDTAAREGMVMGAYYGGLAINQVNVGNVHAIAHQIGGKYGIPHGLANSLVLPHVLEFCLDQAAPRLAELARLIGLGNEGDSDADLARAFIQAVRELRAEVGIPDTSDKIKAQDYDYLCDLAMDEGAGYPVPRLLDRDSTIAILGNITA